MLRRRFQPVSTFLHAAEPSAGRRPGIEYLPKGKDLVLREAHTWGRIDNGIDVRPSTAMVYPTGLPGEQRSLPGWRIRDANAANRPVRRSVFPPIRPPPRAWAKGKA